MSDSTKHSYDAIIIGAGLNGLTAATLLAQAGRRVVVLERRAQVGGIASSTEFHPGYFSSGLLHDTTGLLPDVVDQLRLEQHGLRRTSQSAAVFVPDVEGTGFLLQHDQVQGSSVGGGVSKKDAESLKQLRAFVARVSPFARRLFSQVSPDWLADGIGDWQSMLSSGIALRKLGKADMMELLRVGPMCIADWLDEYFESQPLKAALALPALHGYFGGPRSPGTAGAFLRHATMAGGSVVGGPQSLVDALLKVARSAGVEIRCSQHVQRIETSGEKTVGVVCVDGPSIPGKMVLASCDSKQTLLDLLDASSVSSAVQQGARQFRTRGLSAQVNLALNAPLRFKGQGDLDIEYARTGQSLAQLEKNFDEAKYGRFSTTPALDIHVPSVAKTSAAPEGHASVSVLIHGVPYDLDGEWSDATKNELASATIKSLANHVENLEDTIVAQQVLSPVDIEKEYRLAGGHLYHGEHGLDQLLVRPVRECARYATPVKGLYLCGSGSHPGGGLTCAPGYIAAQVAIKDART